MSTRRALYGLAFLVATFCGAARAADAPPDGPALLRAFFAEEDAARRAALAAKFAAAAPKSWADLKTMLHAAAGRPALEAGRHPFETKAGANYPAVKYVLRVPAGYTAEATRGWPLIITCHGTGGNPEGALSSMEGWLGPDVEQYLVAAPMPPPEGSASPEWLRSEHALAVLHDVRRQANVDSDRAVLTGFSKGGYTSWAAAIFAPGEWAGVAPMACYPMTEAGAAGVVLYLPNVLNLSIQAHWGANDIEPGQKEGINTLSREAAAEFKRLNAAKYEGIEYPGEGHNLHIKADRFRAFAAAAKREPFPAENRLLFHHLFRGRNYYVRATALARDEFDFHSPRTLTVTRVQDVRKIKRDLLMKEGFELTARMPAGQNLVAVMARNIKEVEVELPAEKLDFSRPVRITVNTRTAQETVRKMDWAELLETVRRTGDFERLIAGRVRVTVATATVVK